MKLNTRYILLLIIDCGLLLTCIAIPDDDHEKDRTKNEIKEDIGYTTDGINQDSTAFMDNFVTTETPLDGAAVKSTPAPSHSTKPPPKPKKKKAILDPVDQYLLEGFLNIVDEKFDTFNKRLSTLERGVHTIQYYNVRGFRTINTHLQTVDTVLHGINRQMDHNSQENKAFDQGLGLIKKEMLDLQSLNTGMFQAIEQNLVHFHKDMQSRLEELKGDMDKANKVMGEVKNSTNEIRMDTDDVRNIQTDILLNTENSMIMTSDVAKGTLFLLNITEHVQQDIAETVIPSITKSKHAITTMNTNVSKLFLETHDIRIGLSNFLSNFSSEIPHRENVFADDDVKDKVNYQELKVTDSISHATCSKILELFEERLKNLTKVSDQTKPVTCNPVIIGGPTFRNQSRKLMRALSTVNENLYQSVTLYKHTGNLVERVIADAELIASDQIKLREDIRSYLFNGTDALLNESLPDMGEFVRFDKSNADGASRTRDNKPALCQLSRESINEISKLSYNGTQIIELLTELATTSTSAIQLNIQKLEAEVNRLHKVQVEPFNNKQPLFSKLDNFARDDPKIGATDTIRDIQNRTEWIYQLTEAIASNTGWIPYLFHSMRFVESQMNKSLKISHELLSKTNDISSKQQIDASSVFKPQRYLTSELLKSQASLHEMLGRFNEAATKQGNMDKDDKNCETPTPDVADLSALTNHSLVLTGMMEFVHGTSVKLNRLIPALTYLLGEPEPYLTLTDGSSDKEGRVEIYYKGQWGTIPGPLSHVEASYICRKLGFLGGLSIGNGSFGPGSGIYWSLNVTCLQTRWCTAVHHAPDQHLLDHGNDVGVKCDHMIRLEPNEEDLNLSRHTGKLEIFHENAWRPVCHDGWGRPETDVVCAQLGFREGAASAVKDETLSKGQWLTGVDCSANEDRLDSCANGGFVYRGCPSSSYVSMICS